MTTWRFSVRCAVAGVELPAPDEKDNWYSFDPSAPTPATERIAAILGAAGLGQVRVAHGVDSGIVIVKGYVTGDTEEVVRTNVEVLVVYAVQMELGDTSLERDVWLSRTPE